MFTFYNVYFFLQGIANSSAGQPQDCEMSSATRNSAMAPSGLLVAAGSINNHPTGVVGGKNNNISSSSGANNHVLKLFRYPCLPSAIPVAYNYGHSSNIMDVQFANADANVITTGGTDSCVFQFMCKRTVTGAGAGGGHQAGFQRQQRRRQHPALPEEDEDVEQEEPSRG